MIYKYLSLALFFVFANLPAAIAAQTAAYMTEPSYSPDRKEIAFVSGGDIWSVSADGGSAQLLVAHAATESRPVYSPDGTRLAFTSNRTGNGDIYILDLRAGSLSRLTFDDIGETLDGWSRDGKWIYFSSAARDIGYSDIYRVAPSGGTPMQVSADRYTNEFFSAPSPDGTSLAFSARGIANGQWWRRGRSHIDHSEIWLKKGETYERVTDSASKNLWPMWGTSSKLFFVSDRSGSENIWSQPIGGAAKPVTDFKDGRVLWANISQDGKQIVFERNFKIWQVNADGGRAAPLPITLRGAASGPLTDRVNMSTQVRELALAPDGKKVAVVSRGEVFAASSKDGGDAVRVTTTVGPELHVAWSRDSRSIVYASERNEIMQLFQYDFGTQAETQITQKGNDYSPVFSPDGKSIAFIRDSRSLMVYDVAGKREREVAKFYTNAPPLIGTDTLAWSPDNKWISFLSNSPETRSYTNVWAVPASGGNARPISFLANSNSGTVTWSPDGTFILFDTNQRTEQTSIARIDLRLRTPKFREDTFRDLFKQESPKERPQTPGQPAPAPSASPTPQPSPAALPESKDDDKATQVVFEGIRERLRTLPVGLDSGSPTISPDGKTLLVVASAEGQTNLYTINIDELATDSTPKQLTSTAGNKFAAQFSPDSKEIYYVEAPGRVMIANLDRRDSRPLAINMEMNVNFAREKMEIFKQGWRYLRDNFYDENFHGADWQSVRKTFEPVIAETKNMEELRRVMSLMVGELNASHLGVSGPSGFTPAPIGKLGVRFDRGEFENSGRLRITEIIPLGPVDITRVGKVGDYLISVDGKKIEAGTNIDELLENTVNRRVDLVFASSADGGGRREVTLKPVTTATERNLLYRQWVALNRDYVEKNSGGRLGYVHIPDMSQSSLNQLYIDLDAQNQGKEGVVIDVRNNNGGFINPYVIDILSRRGYLNMTERGKWPVPGRANLGQRALERPTILITNQHSLSDAEDLTEGYRALKLGKVVGEPTAGWIIFTWNAGTFDGTTVRLPRQLVTDASGKNMELNPRPVDIPVTRPIGETYTGKDSQLDAAIKSLLADVGKQASR